jgi:hypothetical protein
MCREDRRSHQARGERPVIHPSDDISMWRARARELHAIASSNRGINDQPQALAALYDRLIASAEEQRLAGRQRTTTKAAS